ncbi:MAG: DUF6090 family protein [Candidatus Neomarinimicrobiota bacterium]|nr:MAG: hypothetical protein CBC68_05455 [Candidatus Marinimicrobia bacterium TMED108]RCL90339.1 MAG: hypothetical protein DBW60_02130 [bacterium]|tara:strand:+ start:629 stop:1309 length:681 start_codon:yes stop_codon:yes gene_type:complete
MKNTLARGGVEFLAVLFGITISLWVEDWRQDRDIQDKILEDYINIRDEIEIDIKNIDRIIASVDKQSELLKTLIKYSNKELNFEEEKILTSLQEVTAPTFFGSLTAYKASVSSGRLNFSTEQNISNEISLLYEHFYKRLDTNSEIYDQRLQILKRDYFIDFYSLIHGKNVFNENTRSIFLSDKMENAMYWILDYVENFYTNRLSDTRIQMINTKISIDKHLKQTGN